MVSNHEFFNVLSPNGPLRPHSALPGSLKIIEDLSSSKGRGEGGQAVRMRDKEKEGEGENK